MTHALSTLADYQSWITSIKQRVQSARLRAALAANSELIALYYELDAQIVERETRAQWGSGFIETFSKRLRFCRAFFRLFCDATIWQQNVAKLANTPSRTLMLMVSAQRPQLK